MRVLSFLTAFVLLVWSLGAGLSAAPANVETRSPAPPRLTGRVVDSTGSALAGVQVLGFTDDGDLTPLDAGRAWPAPPASSTSDANGRFELRLGAGRVRLSLRKPGYTPRDVEGLQLGQHGATDVGPLALAYARGVSGRVIDAQGVAVDGARILALMTERMNGNEGGRVARFLTTTDVGGGFTTDELDEGTWTLVVDHERQPETRFADVVPHGRTERHIELALPQGATIAGMVVTDGPRGSAPLVVHALPLSATDAPEDVPAPELLGYRSIPAGSDGAFELHGLRAGESYSLHALPEGVPPRRHDAWSKPELVAAGSRDVTLEAAYGTSVQLTVLDNRTGEPVTTFAVRLFDGFADRSIADDGSLRGDRGRPWLTHPKGRVQVHGLRPALDGPATLTVVAPCYEPYEVELELAPSTVFDLDEVHLTPRPSLALLVTDGETGEAVRGAQLSVVPLTVEDPEDEPSRASTGPDGHGRVEDRPGRARALGVSALGYAPVVLTSPFETVEAEDGELVHVALERGASAQVKVTGSDGEPLPGVPVLCEIEDDDLARFGWTFQRVHTGHDGVAHFRGLSHALHRFVAHEVESPAPHEWAAARVDDDDEVFVALGAPPPARYDGVVSEAGEPLAGATLTLRRTDEDADTRYARSNDRGAFELFGLRTGTYEAEWNHPSRAMPWRQRVELDPGRNEVRVELPITVLTGTVYDEQGRPVVGARIKIGGVHAQTDVFEQGRPQTLVRTDFAGSYALRGVDPDRALTIVAIDPASDGRASAEAPPARRLGMVDGPDLYLTRTAELRLAPDPPGLTGPHALLATYQLPDEGVDATLASGVEERAVVPYTGGEAVFEHLAPGTWTLTVAQLDGFGRVLTSWELVTVELVAGETRTLVPE